MVALNNRDIDGFLAKPPPGQPVILLHGPDAGLVAERATVLLRSAVDDPDDPFSLVRLEGDDIAGDPARLVDEALTVPLFGGRRAIHVKAGTRNIAASVEALLAAPVKECRIVIEASELRRESPLRKVCERAKNAAVLTCYADTERDIARLIDTELRESKLQIASDARAALVTLLGGDRLASRNELRKLTLYALGRKEITLDDIRAIMTDASALGIDPIADGAFAGRHADVENALAKAFAAGIHPTAVMASAQRHAAQLHKARLAIEGGASFDQAKETVFPRLHFSRKGTVDAALQAWTATRLVKVIEQLADAALDVRRRNTLARAITQRTLMAVSAAARARSHA